MKKILLALFVFNVSSAQAEIFSGEFIRTPFWSAPYANQISVGLSLENEARMKDMCAEYSSHIDRLKTGRLSESKRELVDSLRKMPYTDDWTADHFQDWFTIADKDMIEVHAQSTSDTSSSIPFASQSISRQWFDFDNSQLVKMVPEEESLSAFSQKLGLKLQALKIVYSVQKGYVIEVENKDIACDLLAHKLELGFQVHSRIRLSLENEKELENFYQFKLMKSFSDVMKSSFPKNKKAILLGYRLGGIVKDNVQENDIKQVEKDFLNLMDKLVDENLEMSRYVVKEQDQFLLDSILYQTEVTSTVSVK